MNTVTLEQRNLYPGGMTHVAIPSPDAITDADIARYHEEGFLAVDGVYSGREVADATAALSHLIMGGNPEYKGVQFEPGYEKAGEDLGARELYVRKCMDFVNWDPRLTAMANQSTLGSILFRILKMESRLIQSMALLKPPRVGKEKPWHQDTAYFLYEPLELIIGTWTALDDATAENGCMHVIPGSHKRGPTAHYHDRDCQIADEAVDVEHDVVVPLKPGGTMFFSGLVHHGTPPNQSASRRRAIQLHYAGTACKPMPAERHATLFVENGAEKRYAGCAAWASSKLKMIPIGEKRA